MELLAGLPPPIDDVDHVVREHEGRAVATEVTESLGVAEKLGEVNMEEMAGLLDHDVIVVAVANAQDVGGNAVAGA